jgi:curved DNA-binding protein CbpA
MACYTHDYYGLLDVARSASNEEIRKAYQKKIRASHPDKSSSSSAHDLAALINSARDTLLNPTTKKQYDEYVKIATNRFCRICFKTRAESCVNCRLFFHKECVSDGILADQIFCASCSGNIKTKFRNNLKTQLENPSHIDSKRSLQTLIKQVSGKTPAPTQAHRALLFLHVFSVLDSHEMMIARHSCRGIHFLEILDFPVFKNLAETGWTENVNSTGKVESYRTKSALVFHYTLSNLSQKRPVDVSYSRNQQSTYTELIKAHQTELQEMVLARWRILGDFPQDKLPAKAPGNAKVKEKVPIDKTQEEVKSISNGVSAETEKVSKERPAIVREQPTDVKPNLESPEEVQNENIPCNSQTQNIPMESDPIENLPKEKIPSEAKIAEVIAESESVSSSPTPETPTFSELGDFNNPFINATKSFNCFGQNKVISYRL